MSELHGVRSAARLLNVTPTSVYISTAKAWADYLGDPPLATAFLDRLVDGAVILKLTGRSTAPIAPPRPGDRSGRPDVTTPSIR